MIKSYIAKGILAFFAMLLLFISFYTIPIITFVVLLGYSVVWAVLVLTGAIGDGR